MKVTITLEDQPNGSVKTTVDPSFETIMKGINAGVVLTSAEAYALFAIRMIREESKRRGPSTILVPRISRV